MIVKVAALRRYYPGGWEGYRDAAPNATFCCDPEITRIGFMQPAETEHHIATLARFGLVYQTDGVGPAIDAIVVDQQHGPMSDCPWLEFGRIPMGPNGELVAACRLAGSAINTVMTPEGWTYENSLTRSFCFVKKEDVDRRMAYLGQQGDVSHWVERQTGKDYFSSPPRPE